MRYVRLFLGIISVSLRRAVAFRANFLAEAMVNIFNVVSSTVVVGVIYTVTDSLGGWSREEALALLGTFYIASGILWAFIEPNLGRFRDQIVDGKLDDVLLKPASSVFMASLGTCSPLELSRLLPGVAILGVGIGSMETPPSVVDAAGWCLLFACGAVFIWAVRVVLASLAFWGPALQPEVLFRAAWEFGRFPVSVYVRPVRIVFMYVVPLSLVATIPTAALTDGLTTGPVVFSIVAMSLALGLSVWMWRAGLRRYTSATS